MKEEYLTGFSGFILSLAIGLGTFMQVLDTSIANVAVPYIAGNLGVSADEGTWVITSFAASNAIVLPLTGWLSDYFGRVRLFVGSVLLFTLVSFLCGLSSSLTMLVTFRVLQGAVAGSLIPLSQSLMVSSSHPSKQGAALGMWGMIVVVAPVLGPIVGGYLTDVYSWPWIFYINVPVGLFSAAVTWQYLKNKESEIVRDPIDWVGLGLLSLGVATMQIMLDKGKDLDWFESNVIIALTITSIASLSYFVIWNQCQKYPIVNFSFFKNRNFLFGTIAITLGFLAYFGSSVVLPLWLQTEQNYTPYWAGVATAPVGVASFFLSTTVGKNMHRFDLRFWAAMSFLLFSMGFFLQAEFTTNVSLGWVMWVRFLQGFGIACFFLPLVQLAMAEIPKEKYASATGLFHFIRILIGSGFGTSLSIEIWTRLEIFHHQRLSEAMVSSRTQLPQFYTTMANAGTQFTNDVTTNVLDLQVQQQAYMLSTNDLSWLGAWMFIALIPFIYCSKRVQLTGPAAHVAAE